MPARRASSTCRSPSCSGRSSAASRRLNAWRTVAEIPAQTAESKAMSKELKRRGFRFIGPTTCYAFMQSAGLVDDHTLDCFRTSAALIFSTAAASASSPPPAALPTASATSSTNAL